MNAVRGFVFWKEQMQEEKCFMESFKENINFQVSREYCYNAEESRNRKTAQRKTNQKYKYSCI